MIRVKLDQNHFSLPNLELQTGKKYRKKRPQKAFLLRLFFSHGGYLYLSLVAVWVTVVIASLIYLGLWRPKSEAAGFETTVTVAKATMARQWKGHRHR